MANEFTGLNVANPLGGGGEVGLEGGAKRCKGAIRRVGARGVGSREGDTNPKYVTNGG